MASNHETRVTEDDLFGSTSVDESGESQSTSGDASPAKSTSGDAPAAAAGVGSRSGIAIDVSETNPSHHGQPKNQTSGWFRAVKAVGKSNDLVDREENYIICPITSEVVDLDDVDGLVELYERIDHLDKILYQVKCEIRKQLLELSEGDAATRRLRGKTRTVKIELPPVKFEQRVLKDLWHAFPNLRDEFLRIENVAVKMAEYKKLTNTACEGDVLAMRDALTRADRGREGLPTVKIEI